MDFIVLAASFAGGIVVGAMFWSKISSWFSTEEATIKADVSSAETKVKADLPKL